MTFPHKKITSGTSSYRQGGILNRGCMLRSGRGQFQYPLLPYVWVSDPGYVISLSPHVLTHKMEMLGIFFFNVKMSFFLFFSFTFISCRLITLQYCSGFCHSLTWISHGFTCIPHPDPPSHLPLYLIPLGLPSAPGPSTYLMHHFLSLWGRSDGIVKEKDRGGSQSLSFPFLFSCSVS